MKPISRDRLILGLWSSAFIISALFLPSSVTIFIAVIGIILFFREVFRTKPAGY